jgi:ABC-type enterochelin transport system substrate-binding protein
MEGTVIDMRSETQKLQQRMKEQDDYLARKFAEAVSPEKNMRNLQEQMQDRASDIREKKSISMFSPA